MGAELFAEVVSWVIGYLEAYLNPAQENNCLFYTTRPHIIYKGTVITPENVGKLPHETYFEIYRCLHEEKKWPFIQKPITPDLCFFDGSIGLE